MCNLDNVVNRKRITKTGYMIAMKIPPVPQLRWSLSKTRHLDRPAWDLGLAQSFRSIRAYLTACQRQSAIQIIARYSCIRKSGRCWYDQAEFVSVEQSGD